jgi:hypothetical protein
MAVLAGMAKLSLPIRGTYLHLRPNLLKGILLARMTQRSLPIG